MANVKISQLPVTTSLTGTDVFPVVSGATTYQVSANVITEFATSGLGNITTVNLNGNASSVLAGDGTWVAQGGGSASLGNLTAEGNKIYASTGNVGTGFVNFDNGSGMALGTNQSANVQIITDGSGLINTWTFDTAGSLTLAGSLISNNSSPAPTLQNFDFVTYNGNLSGIGNTFALTAKYNPISGNGFDLEIIGGPGNDIGNNGGNVNISSGLGNTAGNGFINFSTGEYTWVMSNTGTLSLSPVATGSGLGEAQVLRGTRTVVGGLGVALPYSTQLAPGGTPTVAYLSTAGAVSTKVTFAVQSSGSGFQWEQFDVVATQSQDVPGAVNFVVSNRVKGSAGIGDTIVTAVMNNLQIEISLTLDAAQTSGGASSFNAVEFALMID